MTIDQIATTIFFFFQTQNGIEEEERLHKAKSTLDLINQEVFWSLKTNARGFAIVLSLGLNKGDYRPLM